MTLADAHQAHRGAVRHAATAPPPATPAPEQVGTSCARCGGPLRSTSAGRSRRGTRFCSPACRFASVQERRAAARGDLVAAMGQLAEATARIERALKTLGLRPARTTFSTARE